MMMVAGEQEEEEEEELGGNFVSAQPAQYHQYPHQYN